MFNQFDTDNSGVITKDNIITGMNKIGHEINQEDLDHIMATHDLERNGVITYNEFKAIFVNITDGDNKFPQSSPSASPSPLNHKADW